MSNTNPAGVTTGKVRLSYLNVNAAKVPSFGGEAQYSATLLIPKTDAATKQRIDAAIEAAIAKGITEKWGGTRPARVERPIYDGDGPRQGNPNKELYGEECRGCWVLGAKNKRQKPKVVDLSKAEILDATEIYSGMYARVYVEFYAYAKGGNIGIGCSLGNIQKLADGEPLGGRSATVDEAFGDDYVEPYQQPTNPYYGAAQPAAAPVYYQPPTQPAPVAPRFNPLTGQYE